MNISLSLQSRGHSPFRNLSFSFFFRLINSKCPIEIESKLRCLEEKESSKRKVGFHGAVAILRRFSRMVPQRIHYSPGMASHRACKLPPVPHYNFLYKSCGRNTASLSYARSQRQLISYFHVQTLQHFIVLHECYPEGQTHFSHPTLGTFVCFMLLLTVI